MKKENLKDEKIQADASEEFKSENLSKCSEQDTQEKFDEPAWRSRAVNFLSTKIDNKETTLLVFQLSRLDGEKWSPFVPYSSYIHFTSPIPDIRSVLLGAIDNLELGFYRFKLMGFFKYHDFWVVHVLDPHDPNDYYSVLEFNVFENNGVKGFEVINCFSAEELITNEI